MFHVRKPKKYFMANIALFTIAFLTEAAGEHITYAKAICEYNNPGLENSISFKVNDCVAVSTSLLVVINGSPPNLTSKV